MAGRWKYIMLETDNGQLLPVLFPEALTHKYVAEEIITRTNYLDHSDEEVAEALSMAVRLEDLATNRYGEWRNATAVSAGFINGLEIDRAFGESESLSMKSNLADTDVINLWTQEQGKPDEVPAVQPSGVNVPKTSAQDIEAEGHKPSCRRYRSRHGRLNRDCSCGATPKVTTKEKRL